MIIPINNMSDNQDSEQMEMMETIEGFLELLDKLEESQRSNPSMSLSQIAMKMLGEQLGINKPSGESEQ